MLSAPIKKLFLCLLGWLVLLSQPAALAQADPAAIAPASQSELARKAIGLKLTPNTPTRGVVTNVSDLLRTEDSARVLNNLQMLRQGVWTSRGIGWQKQRASAFNSGAEFKDFSVQSTTTGDNLLFQVGGKVYIYDIATSTETELYSGTAPTNPYCIRAYSPTMVIFCDGDGNIEPKAWDGNTANDFVDFSGYPWPASVGARTFTKPKLCEPLGDRMVFGGFADYPNTVLISYKGTPNRFYTSSPLAASDAGYLEVPAALGPIVGLRTLKIDSSSPETVVLVGCTRGFALVTGNSALNYAAIELTREFGLASNRTWVQLNNDLYFLATDGIRKFSSLSQSSTLGNQAVSFSISNLVTRINKTQAHRAWAVHHPATQEVQWWYPIDSGTQCDHGVVMNYNTKTASELQGRDIEVIWSSRDGTAIACGVDFNGVMYGGSYDGFLQQHYSGDTYGGSAINWQFVGPLVGANNPAQAANARRWVILLDGPTQKFDATAYTLTTFSDGSTGWVVSDTANLQMTASSVSAIDTWGSGTTTTYPKFLDFRPKGNGRFWTLKLSGDATDEHISLVGVLYQIGLGGQW